MTAKRLPFQLELDLPEPGWGEAPRKGPAEAETAVAMRASESPAGADRLMEAICDFENVETAARAVMRNKGAPGVDGMTVKQLPDALEQRWPQICARAGRGALSSTTGQAGENPQAGRG
jgi:RNA-directed DNA polymerase